MSQEDMKEALLKFVVASRQPISLVDGPRFKKAFVPKYQVFWKQHESMFPRLSVLAKFLFGWQPSSAPSERTFKELRYVVENFTRTIPRGIIDSSRKELLHLFIHDLCF
uniref:HAT C-terminal dimerisation domain-containing protein n=1 Tax=Ditylenchus dipsaci TaxID=166011 RepID=A0A915DSJ7_9BILA